MDGQWPVSLEAKSSLLNDNSAILSHEVCE